MTAVGVTIRIKIELCFEMCRLRPCPDSIHSEHPFWRLQHDGIWEVPNSESFQARESNDDAKKSELLKYEAVGGFASNIFEELRRSVSLQTAVTMVVLYEYFPKEKHDEILEAVGLSV